MGKIVCPCMNMTKEQIVAEVKATGSTKAGTACGVCMPEVNKIVAGAK